MFSSFTFLSRCHEPDRKCLQLFFAEFVEGMGKGPLKIFGHRARDVGKQKQSTKPNQARPDPVTCLKELFGYYIRLRLSLASLAPSIKDSENSFKNIAQILFSVFAVV